MVGRKDLASIWWNHFHEKAADLPCLLSITQHKASLQAPVCRMFLLIEELKRTLLLYLSDMHLMRRCGPVFRELWMRFGLCPIQGDAEKKTTCIRCLYSRFQSPIILKVEMMLFASSTARKNENVRTAASLRRKQCIRWILVRFDKHCKVIPRFDRLDSMHSFSFPNQSTNFKQGQHTELPTQRCCWQCEEALDVGLAAAAARGILQGGFFQIALATIPIWYPQTDLCIITSSSMRSLGRSGLPKATKSSYHQPTSMSWKCYRIIHSHLLYVKLVDLILIPSSS